MKKSFFLLGYLLLLTACQPTTPTPVAALLPTATLPPTPTFLPVTDTPVPTPEASPTPFPQFFTDEFDGSLAGWVILQAGSDATPNIKNENSRLLMQMDAPYSWIYALYGPQDYDAVRVDTKFVNNALSPASMGLICNYDETDGWLEYNVSTDGTYNVLFGKWLSSGVADYLPILDGSSNQIAQSGVEQQIGMTCSNGTLALYINDTLIRNVDVTRYERGSGKVGITASSYENTPVIASFDSVRVSTP
ncbi:MAG: lipoprotein [Byssovorax cruenta]